MKIAVDIWPPAIATYRLNHPDTDVRLADLRIGSVLKQLARDARGVDLILGGIPCEWLSSYRVLQKVGTAELEQNRLLLDQCLGLVRKINPRWWCLEDVKQLAHELPPLTPWQEINARQFSPQRRKRIFVGNFPTPKGDASDLLLRDRIRRGPYRIGRRAFDRTPQLSRTFNGTTTLAAPLDRKAPTVLSNCSKRDAEMVVVDPSIPGGKRQMEWQEMADLQGFPADYVFFGSPTDVAKQIGRAMQIDTGRAILQAICREANAH